MAIVAEEYVRSRPVSGPPGPSLLEIDESVSAALDTSVNTIQNNEGKYKHSVRFTVKIQ